MSNFTILMLVTETRRRKRLRGMAILFNSTQQSRSLHCWRFNYCADSLEAIDWRSMDNPDFDLFVTVLKEMNVATIWRMSEEHSVC